MYTSAKACHWTVPSWTCLIKSFVQGWPMLHCCKSEHYLECHLTAFNPKSIITSTNNQQEINRFQKLHRPDLPCYGVPCIEENSTSRKHKLSGICDGPHDAINKESNFSDSSKRTTCVHHNQSHSEVMYFTC